MRKLIAVCATVAALLAAYSLSPVAECQSVGAPCGAGTQASVALQTQAGGGVWFRDQPAPTETYSDYVSNESTATSYTFVDADGGRQVLSTGELPTGTYTYTCDVAYGASCGLVEPGNLPVIATLEEILGLEADCAVTGTSENASMKAGELILQVPLPLCTALAQGVVGAPPNDQATITIDDLLSSVSGADSYAYVDQFGYSAPAEFLLDGCSAVLDPLLGSITYDKQFVIDNLGTPAASATGICCVAETAFNTPAQSGCLYQGESYRLDYFGPFVGDAYVGRCGATAAPPGSAAGMVASDVCTGAWTIVDSNNVCPQSWCTLNPGDPNCIAD